MRVVTTEQMRQIDNQTIEQVGIPAIVLMENAGRAILDTVNCHFPGMEQIGIIVGKGNNGGDGLVIARHLAMSNRAVTVYLAAAPDDFTGQAKTNLKIVRNLGIPIVECQSRLNPRSSQEQVLRFDEDLLIDAIFGIGLSRRVEGKMAEVIRSVNRSEATVVSVDVPSGLDADTGQSLGVCIESDLTVTVGLPKIGLLIQPGAKLAGKIEVAEIGFPDSIIENQQIQTHWTTDVDLVLPGRPSNSHKGVYGRVFVLSGSTGMTGAATLTSQAALKSGTGLVTLGIPQRLNSIMEAKLTEVMTLPLPDTEEGTLDLTAERPICNYTDQKQQVLAIGPGLSRHSSTVALILRLANRLSHPMVIDADGLNAFSEEPALLLKLSQQNNRQMVITPHLGEMSRLTGRSIEEVADDPMGVAIDFAYRYQMTVALKSVPVTVASPQGQIWLNSTGNAGMATAGSGDVLTGVIAGLMAQGLHATDAAVTGVYLHGLAGDLAAEILGQHSLMATDILNYLPQAIGKVMTQE